jgi:glycosyltransferase involved in cell wall biosynthesis
MKSDLNSKCKILLVNFSNKGGFAHHIYFLCDALSHTGVDFLLLTTRNFELAERCGNFRCETRLFAHADRKFKLVKGIVYCISLLILLNYVRKYSPAVLHLQDLRIPVIEKWLLAGFRKKGIKLIYTVHDIDDVDVAAVTHYAALQQVYHSFDYLIAHTEENKQTLIQVFDLEPERITVLPVGEYTALPDGQLEQSAARDLLGIAADRPVILFFGYIRKYKGLGLLLEALARVKEQEADIYLIVAGEPKEELSAYRKMIAAHQLESNLLLDTRYIPLDRLSAYFAAADLVVLPYLRVFQSGLVRLAYAHKRPVIATRVGDLPMVVEHGQTGFLVPPGSAERLAEAINLAFCDRHRLRAMGENGFQMMSRKFSWQHIAEEMKKIYHKAITNELD